MGLSVSFSALGTTLPEDTWAKTITSTSWPRSSMVLQSNSSNLSVFPERRSSNACSHRPTFTFTSLLMLYTGRLEKLDNGFEDRFFCRNETDGVPLLYGNIDHGQCNLNHWRVDQFLNHINKRDAVSTGQHDCIRPDFISRNGRIAKPSGNMLSCSTGLSHSWT